MAKDTPAKSTTKPEVAAKPKKAAAKKALPKTAVKKVTPKAAVKSPAAKPAPKKVVPKAKVKAASKTAQHTASATSKTSTPDINFMNLFGMESIMPQQPNFQFDKLAQEAANASREQAEAFIKSGTIFAQGFEDIIKTATTMAQAAAEKQQQFAKEIMASKTLNEYAEAQNKISQANFDEFMAGATKISEMSAKLLNESAAPLNEQVAKAMKQAGKMAA